jgi:hypothetical protein
MAIGLIPLLAVVVVAAIILGFATKKWSKVMYALSGALFLAGIITAFIVQKDPSLRDLLFVLIFFGLGFLVSSINGVFKKK